VPSSARSGARSHSFTWLDVFTETPLAGNGLAVVHDADGVDEETMLRFARETRLSETTFVQSPTVSGADYRNRIWTVTKEVPFAGHPSLGTAVAVARSRGEREARYVQQTGVGLQPVDVRLERERWFASVLQERAEFGAELDAGPVMAAVGLEASDAERTLPPQVVSTGLPALIAAVSEEAAVSRAAPNPESIDALQGEDSFNLYLCWCDPARGRARARMFNPSLGPGEDPATGSAAGPLCAYLAQRMGCTRLEISQGAEMGRPSRLLAELEGDRVRVGGGVVPVIDGRVRLNLG